MFEQRSEEITRGLYAANSESQYAAIRSNCDFVVLTGSGGGGKSSAMLHAWVSDARNNPNSRGLLLMRNINDFFKAGSVVDNIKKIIPLNDKGKNEVKKNSVGEIVRGDEQMGIRLKAPNNSELRFFHVANEDLREINDRIKNIQIKKIYVEEAHMIQWSTVSALQTRMRDDSNNKAQVYIAQNIERDSFISKMCRNTETGGGWIDDDTGMPIESMNGVVRYFHVEKGDLDKCYWGASKHEVYMKAKDRIDRLMGKEEDMSYEDFIFSMVFFTLDARDNKQMLSKNKSYRASLSQSILADSMYENNWNYSVNDEDERKKEAIVSAEKINAMFHNKPNWNEKKRVTIDPAAMGMDNLVMIYWEGFHAVDLIYEQKSEPLSVINLIKDFLAKHNVEERHLVIDVQSHFSFLATAFPRAFRYGAGTPSNRGKKSYVDGKDEAADVASQMINNGLITFDYSLKYIPYKHQRSKRATKTLVKQMEHESIVFRFESNRNGKRQMITKKMQHSLLHGASPDIMDNIIMLVASLIYDCYKELSLKKNTDTIKEENEIFNVDSYMESSSVQNKPRGKVKDIADLINARLRW